MAEDKEDLESLVSRAKEQEKEYDWSGAADSYKHVLDSLSELDALRKGEIQEALAYALYRMAFQADSPEEFRMMLDRATAAYQIAEDLYAESDDERGRPKRSRCESMIAFSGYWRAIDASEKKRFVEQTWTLAKDALKGFARLKSLYDFGKTYNDSILAAWAVFAYTDEFETRRSIASETLAFGEEAVEMLSQTADSLELARAYLNTCHAFSCFDSEFPHAKDVTKYSRKRREFWLKGYQRLDDAALGEIGGMAPQYGLPTVDGLDETSGILERIVEQSHKTHDKLLIGFATEWFARSIMLTCYVAEFPETRELAGQNALSKMKEADKNFSALSFTPFVMSTAAGRANAWPPTPELGIAASLAWFEPDLDKKRKLAKQALDAGEDQLRVALRSGYPDAICFTHLLLADALVSLAKTEKDPLVKKELLNQFVEHGKQWTEYYNRVAPGDCPDMGGYLYSLARTEFELAETTDDVEEKKRLLRTAAGRGKEVYSMLMRSVRPGVRPIVLGFLGLSQRDSGHYSVRLFELTNDMDDLRPALESFERAMEGFQRAEEPTGCAECSWEKAKIHDLLEEQMKASEEFLRASAFYRVSAEKYPHLVDLYQDHALYMQAWSEIELAKYHHARQDSSSALEHYEKAAQLHQSTRRWQHLAHNYQAWARLEAAESLSKNEKSSEASAAFADAANLFRESMDSVQAALSTTDDPEQRKMAAELVGAADARIEYSRARAIIEEARLLDKNGEEFASSEKYGAAVAMLQKTLQCLKSEQDRKEIHLILTLSKAWQLMVRAEAESVPDLYEDASALFEEAKDLTPGDKAKLLALGHSRFCKALKAGAKFVDTRDTVLHSEATKHLEGAASCYLKAGFKDASEHAKASKLLFDGYVQMDKANREEDTDKKARLFAVAEKILDASASSYDKAGQRGKREQVLRLLEKVKEEKELAVSLTEVLKAPDIISNTTVLSSPSPTHEVAVGLDRFEHADIHATMIVRPRDLKIGEDLDIEIELVNAGNRPAQLTKLDEAVPKGFDVVKEPEKYRIEDSYLNLRGRRLDALKTEDVKLVLKPTVQGHFTLKPRIMYLDETGKYKSCETEPVDVVVKELGISGWLKGPEKKR